MAFAELPGSHLSINLSPPDWTRFASQAVEAMGKRPIIDTSGMVEKAVKQINDVLKQSSPLEREKRMLAMEQTRALREVYADWRKDKSKYKWTANGPVMIDPWERFSKRQIMKKRQLEIEKLSRKDQPDRTYSNSIQEYLDARGGKVPGLQKAKGSPEGLPEPVGGANAGTDEDDEDRTEFSPDDWDADPNEGETPEITGEGGGEGMLPPSEY